VHSVIACVDLNAPVHEEKKDQQKWLQRTDYTNARALERASGAHKQ
jgi:hypothetical protein